MFEKLLDLDRQLFLFLNGLGSETYDGFWVQITRHYTWTPVFLLLLFLIYKKIGGKQTLILLLFVAALIAFSDQITNLFKSHFHRLRPCSNPNLKGLMRIVEVRDSFGFFSAHAATSMAVSTFLFSLMRRYYRYFWLLFLWPLIFGFSRIYLGLHYPSDVFCGYIFGAISGLLMFKLYKFLQQKYFPSQISQHPTDR